MNNIFFFQTQQILDSSSIFDQLKQQNIFFSYFQVDQKYYLFFYSQKSIDIHFLYQSVDVIQELDSKQRKIRSFRGFFLYALEILENGKNYEILETNLQPFFWRKVKNIIRQNKKAALQEFLFGSQESIASTEIQNDLKDKIESLENQVNSLQQKVIQLEAKFMAVERNSKYALSDILGAPRETKNIHQGDSTLKNEKSLQSANLLSNDSKVNLEVKEPRHPISESLSEASKIPLKPLSITQQYNIPSNQKKGLNEPNFITFGKISEDEKIEIIKTGFQLQAESKISFKKYYESTDPYSLFQLKGYNIKYETIRRTKLYQSLKE